MMYRVTLLGCDDWTTIDIDLTEDEKKLLERIAGMSEERSSYGCQPTLGVELIEEEKEDE